MEELDLAGRYVFTGATRREEAGLRLTWAGGEALVEDTPELVAQLEDLITALDGAATLRSLCEQRGLPPWVLRDILPELVEAGAIHDVRDAWAYFHRASGNPYLVAPRMTAAEAYALPRWRPPEGDIVADLPPVGTPSSAVLMAACRRHSADLEQITPTSRTSSVAEALALAAHSYRVDARGHRPVASGGAMWPLQLWVVGVGVGDDLDILFVDHDAERVLHTGTVTNHQWQTAFIEDPAVKRALGLGAATIVITADPSRVCGKYGSRGWRFVLMEVGAVTQQIMLLAAERNVEVRPIGGFYDSLLSRTLDPAVRALLTILVVA